MCPWDRSQRPSAYLPECCQNTFVNLKCLSVFMSIGDSICKNKQLMGGWETRRARTRANTCRGRDGTVSAAAWPLAWGRRVDEQVDRALWLSGFLSCRTGTLSNSCGRFYLFNSCHISAEKMLHTVNTSARWINLGLCQCLALHLTF